MKRVLSLALLIALVGCGREPTPVIPSATSNEQPADPPFVGKVWISATPGAAFGSMLIFLPDRTLVMDSCFETYRLVKWGIAGEHIRWLEDTIPIEAAVEMPRPNQLILRIAGSKIEQTYYTAAVPYTCPSNR
jgi:hypothetical protein